MVVVLPAPFGPSSPTISLRRTSKEMWSTAKRLAVALAQISYRKKRNPAGRLGRSGDGFVPRVLIPGAGRPRPRLCAARFVPSCGLSHLFHTNPTAKPSSRARKRSEEWSGEIDGCTFGVAQIGMRICNPQRPARQRRVGCGNSPPDRGSPFIPPAE